MNEKRTGLFENGLIWFGAGVSIAEILTGTYLAPLGMGKRSGSDSYRPYHRMPDAVSGRRDRRQGQKKCHGNRKNEFWTEGKHPFCCPECIAARWLDRHHDL